MTARVSVDSSHSGAIVPAVRRGPRTPAQAAVLGRLASALSDAAQAVQELAQVQLDDAPESTLMSGMQTTTTIGIWDLALDYLADLELRVSPRHFGQAKARLNKVLGVIGNVPADEVKPMDVIRFRIELKRDGASDRTCDTYIQPVKAMLNWAVEMGVIAMNPLGKLKNLSTQRSQKRCVRRAMTDDEIERFISLSRRDDEDNDARAATEGIDRVPQTPLWMFLLDTGARWNEARQVTWADVDLEKKLVVLRAENTKSKKRRVIPLTASLESQLRTLNHLRDDHSDADEVFLTPEGRPWGQPTNNPMRIFKRILMRAGIDAMTEAGKLDIHALRHTFGSRLARRGVSLVKTQRLMGHSDPKLTEGVYAHLDVDDLREAMEVL